MRAPSRHGLGLGLDELLPRRGRRGHLMGLLPRSTSPTTVRVSHWGEMGPRVSLVSGESPPGSGALPAVSPLSLPVFIAICSGLFFQK